MARPVRRLGLRARSTVATGIAALVVSTALSFVTYTYLRAYLLNQREDVALRQTYANASVIRDVLRTEGKVSERLRGLQSEAGGVVLLRYNSQWFSPTAFNTDLLPDSVKRAVQDRTTGRQRVVLNDQPSEMVSVWMPEVEATYLEAFPLTSLLKTLATLRNSLTLGTILTSLGGAALGAWSSRRVLRPLGRVSLAASDLAAGGLDTRLPAETDPDLERLVDAFNTMASAVQSRIERETRFASDVSHELRTPLAAVLNAAEVLERRRDELSDRSRQALDVLLRKVERFDRTTQDLLELSRLDAGADRSHLDAVVLPDLMRRIANSRGYRDLPVAIQSNRLREPLMLDKRRLERIVGNLLDNARLHGGGPIGIELSEYGGDLRVVVDDAGPGVPADERNQIFERFSRGNGASQRPGSGLGLALVAEHAARLGGTVAVTDRPGGGARFTVAFPSGAAA